MKTILSFVYLLSIVVFIILYIFLPVTYDNPTEIAVLVYTLLMTISFFKSYQHMKGKNNNRFSPIILFIVGFLIVFYQYYVDVVFGIKSPADIAFLSSDLILRSTILSSIGLFAFFLGATTTNNVTNRPHKTLHLNVVYDMKPIRVLFVISAALWLIYNLESCLSGTYSQEDLERRAGTMSNYSNILFMMSYLSLLAFSANNCRKIKNRSIAYFFKEIGVVPLVSILVFVLLTMNLGDRGPIITVLSSLCGTLLISTNKHISWGQLVIGLTIVASFFTLIGLARGVNGESMYDKMRMVEARPDETCLPVTAELAASQQILQYAIENVPEKYDFFYGGFQLRQILAAIPFSSRVTSLFIDQDWRLRSSAFFMTYLIQGDFYAYGNGTSLIADLYLSFGIIGVIIGMLWLGRIMMKNEVLVDSMQRSNMYVLLLYVCFCGYAVVESRSSLLSPFNYIMFSLITTYFIMRISPKKQL